MFDVQHFCPAHQICRENGNFKEATCKISNNTRREISFQCAAGVILMLDKVLKSVGKGKDS